MKAGINTVTHCAVVVEIEGEVWQVLLNTEQSNQVMQTMIALCGGTLTVDDHPIASISLESA